MWWSHVEVSWSHAGVQLRKPAEKKRASYLPVGQEVSPLPVTALLWLLNHSSNPPSHTWLGATCPLNPLSGWQDCAPGSCSFGRGGDTGFKWGILVPVYTIQRFIIVKRRTSWPLTTGGAVVRWYSSSDPPWAGLLSSTWRHGGQSDNNNTPLN